MRKFTWRSLYKPLFTSVALLASISNYAQYCIPTSTYGCGDQDDINSFSLTGENGTSIIDLNTGCSTDGYEDKTALPAVNLGQGISYPANISSEYSSDYAAVWIDFNDNSAFESTELVGFLNQDVSLISSTINLAIPASAALGNHRMRVSVYYPGEDLSSATVTSCNDGTSAYEYGETQDYTINVVLPPACPAPLQATSVDITASSVTLSWQGTGSYIVEYGPTGFAPGTGATAGAGSIISSATSPLTISNLTALTTYDFYIRHDCSATANGYSANASLLQVKTAATPPFNDLCSGATVLSSGVTCNPISGTTTNATTSGNTSSCEIENNYADVWYSFVATHAEHMLTIASIMATNPDQYDSYFGIAFYAGDCGTLGSQFNCQAGELYQEDSASLSINLSSLTIGQTYYIRLWKDAIYDDNFNEISGDLTFNVCITDPPPPPVNDLCANTLNIPISTSTITQAVMATLAGASVENNMSAPSCSTSASSEDVWFTTTIPPSGNIMIQPSGVNAEASDLVMEVYTGSCGALTELACNDDGGPIGGANQYEPKISLTNQIPGTVLYVRVMPYNNSDKGQFTIAAWDSVATNPTPIVLKSISAKNMGTANIVYWNTGVEDAGDYFELERSANGKQFSKLDKIAAKGKASDYAYTDNDPLQGANYYRLKFTGTDKKTAYSKIVEATVNNATGVELEAFPNPTHKYLTVKVIGTQNGKVTLTDISGRIIRDEKMNGSEMHLDLQTLSNGFYLIHYVDNNLNKVIKVNKQ